MSVTEAQRHQLFESAKAAFGESSAEIFMNMNPNLVWENLATKSDLEAFATKQDLVEMEARLMRHLTTILVGTQGTLLVALSLVFTLALALT